VEAKEDEVSPLGNDMRKIHEIVIGNKERRSLFESQKAQNKTEQKNHSKTKAD